MEMDTRVENRMAYKKPLVSVVIPVGGNRIKSIDELKACVNSILLQDHKNVEVILVIDPDNQMVKDLRFFRPIRLVEYIRPSDINGRDASERRKMGCDNASGEIIVLTNVHVVWPPKLISTALKIMEEEKVQALDGVSRRMPRDERSFLGRFQDEALITEWARYKRDFLLAKDTFDHDLHLPTFLSFFMTQQFYKQYGHIPPKRHGWDDYNTVKAMVDSGAAIFCTNRVVAFRNHPLSLRLAKQFTSGLASIEFCIENPGNPYARKRLRLTTMAAALGAIYLLSSVILMAITSPLLGFAIALGPLCALLALLGTYNAFKIKEWSGFLFPPLTALQVILVVLGFLYGGVDDLNTDSEFLDWLHKRR